MCIYIHIYSLGCLCVKAGVAKLDWSVRELVNSMAVICFLSTDCITGTDILCQTHTHTHTFTLRYFVDEISISMVFSCLSW